LPPARMEALSQLGGCVVGGSQRAPSDNVRARGF
jgi:hypothetical protein